MFGMQPSISCSVVLIVSFIVSKSNKETIIIAERKEEETIIIFIIFGLFLSEQCRRLLITLRQPLQGNNGLQFVHHLVSTKIKMEVKEEKQPNKEERVLQMEMICPKRLSKV